MPHVQRHPAHRMRAHRVARADRATRITQTCTREPEIASAQMVFYVARGIAVLLAAVAVGLSAASDEAERTAAAPSHASAR